MGEEESLYLQRLKKELQVPKDEVIERMNWDLPLLSENSKCSVSLDFPVLNCNPTKICSQVCYACQGRQFYKKAIVKSLAVNRLVSQDPEHAAWKMRKEAKGRVIRIAGSGELLPEQIDTIYYLERYGVRWWGFTRRIDTYQNLPRMMFSLDFTSPQKVFRFVKENIPVKKRTFIICPEEKVPQFRVGVTFPVHGPWTNYVERTPVRKSDCPACRGGVEGCWECGRCY